ncbi:MAG TPA: hypothetical protein ENK99_03955 [Campylobacterales bacterium]|nr:hypothetical protein [Arcobacter sp.]HHD80742.1 hypothetical protein [Campylobacterales bacterium]
MSYNQRLANLQKNVSTNELKNADLDFVDKLALNMEKIFVYQQVDIVRQEVVYLLRISKILQKI